MARANHRPACPRSANGRPVARAWVPAPKLARLAAPGLHLLQIPPSSHWGALSPNFTRFSLLRLPPPPLLRAWEDGALGSWWALGPTPALQFLHLNNDVISCPGPYWLAILSYLHISASENSPGRSALFPDCRRGNSWPPMHTTAGRFLVATWV